MTFDEIATITLDVVTVGVKWALVPLIVAGVVVLARSIVVRAEEGELRTSARAGGWAGLVLFFFYFVHSLPAFRPPGLEAEVGLGLHVGGIVLGAVVALAILVAATYLAPARVVGFVVLFLTFSGLTAFHSYVFLEDPSATFVGFALGAVVGTLLHMMVFPGSLTELPESGESEPEEAVYRPPPSRRSGSEGAPRP